MFCSGCGAGAAQGAVFCSKCGLSLGETEPLLEPIVIDGRTYKPGTGPYAGLYAAPGQAWVRIESGRIVKGSTGSRSSQRTVGGVICLIVAGLAGVQGVSWFSGFTELDAAGNQFAGMLAVLGLGAFVVAAGFGVAGLVLLSRNR